MWYFWKFHLRVNFNSLAVPQTGRGRSHMMWCMVWWKVQEGEEGEKEHGSQTLQECTGIWITECVREIEERQKWMRIVRSSKCPKSRRRLRELLWVILPEPYTIPETSQLVIMTGSDDTWLAGLFSDWALTCHSVLSGHKYMNGRLWGCSNLVEWQQLPYCLSWQSQSLRSWLALSRFWNEIDWQFSDPRIVTDQK